MLWLIRHTVVIDIVEGYLMLRIAFLSLLVSSFLGPSLYSASKETAGNIQSYKISD